MNQRPRIALALSGGGFRAALFHLGVIRRLAELDWLRRVDVISGVSGGSILAAYCALRWQEMLAGGGTADSFRHSIVEPFVREVTSSNFLRQWSLGFPTLLLRKVIGRRVSRTTLFGEKLGTSLYDNRVCSDLPERPFTVLNATSLTSIRAWRFTRHGMGDSRIGYPEWDTGAVPLGFAVAASAAFPPVFAAAEIDSTHYRFSKPIYGEPELLLPKRIALTDGGVYENVGTEVLIKPTRLPGDVVLQPAEFIVVSDAGYPAERAFDVRSLPGAATAALMYRANIIAMEQIAALRRRMLIASFQSGENAGLLVTLGSSIDRMPANGGEQYRSLVGSDTCIPEPVLDRVRRIRTHLNRFSAEEADVLMYHAYSLTDAFLWANRYRHPSPYQRPDGPLGWERQFNEENTATLLASLARSDRIW